MPETAKNTVRNRVFCWWEEVDSNYRSRRRQIYSLIHLATLESSHGAESTIYGVVHVLYCRNMGCEDCGEILICTLFVLLVIFPFVS